MSGAEVPEWAIEKAKDLAVGEMGTITAFARYIAENEEPPRHPDEEVAWGIAKQVWDAHRRAKSDFELCEMSALAALRRGMALAPAARLTWEQEREVLWRAYDAVRGTNADMCRSASQAYRLCCAAVKDLYDTALTQQMEGRDG